MTSKVTETVAILRKGPSALTELEAKLETLSLAERIELSNVVNGLGVSAPRIVHYSYDAQRWFADMKSN